MHVVALVLAMSALAAAAAGRIEAAGCRPCAFGGLCLEGETSVQCRPSRSGCAPAGGILGFNSIRPNVPAYWTLFARGRGRRSLHRLAGRLEVWSDYSAGPPSAPGLPAGCDAASENFPVCSGATARFSGTVANDRLTGVARYRDGATCEFEATIAFGLGEGERNTFVCRAPSGEVMSQGALQVQLIRLKGCTRRARGS
jgi:hypothetical protein